MEERKPFIGYQITASNKAGKTIFDTMVYSNDESHAVSYAEGLIEGLKYRYKCPIAEIQGCFLNPDKKTYTKIYINSIK